MYLVVDVIQSEDSSVLKREKKGFKADRKEKLQGFVVAATY